MVDSPAPERVRAEPFRTAPSSPRNGAKRCSAVARAGRGAEVTARMGGGRQAEAERPREKAAPEARWVDGPAGSSEALSSGHERKRPGSAPWRVMRTWKIRLTCRPAAAGNVYEHTFRAVTGPERRTDSLVAAAGIMRRRWALLVCTTHKLARQRQNQEGGIEHE